jgi:hypothetical protein
VVGLEPDHARAPRLVIAEEADPAGGRRGRLCWSLDLAALDGDHEPFGRTWRIDAVSGELVSETSNVHAFDVRGRIVAMATPGVMPDTPQNPEVAMPVRYLEFETSAGAVCTDANGEFVIPGAASPLEATLRFRGTFNDVTNAGNLGTYVQNVVLVPDTPNELVMNRTAHVQNTAAANVFQVVDRMRDWVRSVNPLDEAADFVAKAEVNNLGGCNAFYFVETLMRFDRQGSNGCVNTAYSTIVAHEHGHWMNDRYGNHNQLNGMGEGNADIFAMYLWDEPVVGDGGGGPIPPPRSGWNTRQFCGDCCIGCFGETHWDGLPWMGAAWKIRARLDLTHGNALGDFVADGLFLAWMNAFDQPQIDSSIEPQWLVLDDDDGDLANGTPNYCDIQCGFREQGFPGFPLPPGCCP